jgi:acetyl esterase/lipase
MKIPVPARTALLGVSALLCPALRAADPQVIDLWPEGVPGLHANATPEVVGQGGRLSNINHPTLTVCLPEVANGTAVIICPGGSYSILSFDHEGFVPAHWLNRLGVTAFIIKNRLKEYGQPAPLQDILRAIRAVRSRAAEFGVKDGRIGVLGFSAGGHLAASAGTLFDAPEGRTGAALDSVSGRPDFMMLVYPVITMEDPFAHKVSRSSLLGANPPADAVRRWSLELQVTSACPPAFLVATEEDKTVPVENSLNFYEALRLAGVPAELHVYQAGRHGFGLNPGNGPTSDWPDRAEDWMRFRGLLPPPPPPTPPPTPTPPPKAAAG